MGTKVSVVLLDLSSFASVASFASTVAKRFSRIHTLLCNAGIESNPSMPALTEDGFERTFQVNFLSHVLLVARLLPALQRSGGRVVSVSSFASFSACEWAGVPNNCTDLADLPASARR